MILPPGGMPPGVGAQRSRAYSAPVVLDGDLVQFDGAVGQFLRDRRRGRHGTERGRLRRCR